MLEPDPDAPPPKSYDDYDSNEADEIVCFRDNGEENTTTIGDKYRSVITDKNGEPMKDDDGNLQYRLGPHPYDLPGKHLNIPHPDTGLPTHVTIGKLVDDYNDGLEKNKVCQAHYELKFNKEDKEDIMSYNDIMDYLSRSNNQYDGEYCRYRDIIGHREVRPGDHSYDGCSINLRVRWEDNSITEQPLNTFMKDAKVDCALYAKKNGLLEKKGWRRLKPIAKREGLLVRLVRQEKLRSFRTSPKYKYGYIVPKDYAQAVELDIKAGNRKWRDAAKLEMDVLCEYKVFIDLGAVSYTHLRAHET